MVGLSLGAATSLFTATLHPDARGRRGRDRLDRSRCSSPAIPGWQTPFDDDPGTDAGWERWTRASWQRDFPGFVEHFVARDAPRAALGEADRGLRRLGPRLRPRGARGDDGLARRATTTREQAEALVAGVRLPGAGRSTATTTASRRSRAGERVAELTGGELVVLEGAGHAPIGARPGARQRADRRVRGARARRPAAPAAAVDARALAQPSARCSSPPRSASATRAATWRSRRELRARVPGPRDRLARPAPADRGAGGGGRARAPGEPAAVVGVGAPGGAVRPRTRSRSSRRSARWTRSSSPTTWSSATSCASSPTTCGSATRRGTSTTSCTRTRRTSARRSCS